MNPCSFRSDAALALPAARGARLRPLLLRPCGRLHRRVRRLRPDHRVQLKLRAVLLATTALQPDDLTSAGAAATSPGAAPRSPWSPRRQRSPAAAAGRWHPWRPPRHSTAAASAMRRRLRRRPRHRSSQAHCSNAKRISLLCYAADRCRGYASSARSIQRAWCLGSLASTAADSCAHAGQSPRRCACSRRLTSTSFMLSVSLSFGGAF